MPDHGIRWRHRRVRLLLKGCRRVAAELIGDLERVYQRSKQADKELKELVASTGTTLMDLHGIGPSGAARLLVEVGQITRFPNRAHFASWNGTAPIDASSGDQVRHRLSRAGNRQINRALHIMATVQLRNPTEGRAYFDRKKAAGKTSMETMRCLKRRLSDIVYRQMLDDATAAMTGPGGHRGTSTNSSVTSSHPHAGSSEKSLPGPATTHPKHQFPPPPLDDTEGSQDSELLGLVVAAGSAGRRQRASSKSSSRMVRFGPYRCSMAVELYGSLVGWGERHRRAIADARVGLRCPDLSVGGLRCHQLGSVGAFEC